MAGGQGRSISQLKEIFQHQRTDKQRQERLKKVKSNMLGFLCYSIWRPTWIHAVPQTKFMDEPKLPTKITLIFNIAWEQSCHRLMNLKIIFNLRNLNKFDVFMQSLVAYLRQELFLHVSSSIWNLASLRLNSTFEPYWPGQSHVGNNKFDDAHQTCRWPVHMPICTLLFRLPLSQPNHWILWIFV